MDDSNSACLPEGASAFESDAENDSATEMASQEEQRRSGSACMTLLPHCSPRVGLLAHAHINGMCRKLSANIQHYGHILHEIASPLLARYSRWKSQGQESLPSVDTIELCHLNGFRLKAISEGDRGHKFVAVILQSPTWCDTCGQTVLGLFRRFLRCKHCSYTCHVACRNLVSISCPDLNSSGHQSRYYYRETSLTENVSVDLLDQDDKQDHEGNTTRASASSSSATMTSSSSCNLEHLNKMISKFNDNKHGLLMELANDEFTGFIRIYLNLCRPISMCLSARPPSLYDLLTHSEPVLDYKQISSFYLPRDTSTVLHINDTTTVQDVITILLRKFNITDDPRKFCLYHKSQKLSQNMMRKLGIYELPLVLCLYWTSHGPNGLDANHFVLQENDTGDIMWDVFSVPELENFLAMLNREEEEYVDRVRSKYKLLLVHMRRRLKQLRSEKAPERKNVLDCL